MPDGIGAGLLVPLPGKEPGKFEPRPPSEGLPLPGRPWAKATAVKPMMKMRKEPRRRSVRMTRPEYLLPEYMPFGGPGRYFVVFWQRFYKSIVQVGRYPRHAPIGE